MVSNGWMFLTWAANYIMDNEGGAYHKVFHVSKRLMFVQPLVNFFLATNVVKANVNYETKNYDWSAYPNCQNAYFFDQRSTSTTSEWYMKPSYYEHMWDLYLYTVVQVIVTAYTQEHLVEQFHAASEWRASQEMEDDAESFEEEAEAEEAAEEDLDEFFF